jgi:hypothetical protein
VTERRGHGAGDRADCGRRLGRGQPKHRYGGLHLVRSSTQQSCRIICGKPEGVLTPVRPGPGRGSMLPRSMCCGGWGSGPRRSTRSPGKPAWHAAPCTGTVAGPMPVLADSHPRGPAGHRVLRRRHLRDGRCLRTLADRPRRRPAIRRLADRVERPPGPAPRHRLMYQRRRSALREVGALTGAPWKLPYRGDAGEHASKRCHHAEVWIRACGDARIR